MVQVSRDISDMRNLNIQYLRLMELWLRSIVVEWLIQQERNYVFWLAESSHTPPYLK